MKKTIKNVLMGIGLISLAISPVKGLTYLDKKFLESIEKGMVSEVDNYLEKGVDVNLRVGEKQETPLMLAVNEIARDERSKDGMRKSGTLNGGRMLSIIPGGIVYVLAMQDLTLDGPLDVPALKLPLITVSGATVLYGVFCGVKGILGLFPYFSMARTLEHKLEIVEMLLKHPDINLTITNTENKTALDLVRDHLSEPTNLPSYFPRQQYWLKRIEVLLTKQASGSTNGVQHA